MELFLSNIVWIVLLTLLIGLFLFKKISNNPDAVTSKFIAIQTIPLDLKTSSLLIKEALNKAGFKKVRLEEPENRFHALSGFSMYSWSEFIEVKITDKQDETEMEFKSICAFPLQIFDWGKNKRNYKKFEKEVLKVVAFRS
jgi:hypothetical protein